LEGLVFDDGGRNGKPLSADGLVDTQGVEDAQTVGEEADRAALVVGLALLIDGTWDGVGSEDESETQALAGK
jgi:hypothetical protein